MAGPFPTPPTPDFVTSPIGAVPKKGSDETRRIHDLSFPHGISVNDHIEAARQHYINFDDAADLARRLGRRSLFAKIDVKSAFRCVPVHPDDRKWLGLIWRDQFYADLALPFGMKSSPALWEQFATLAEWILHNKGLKWVKHYVDDFIIAGPPGSDECKQSVATICNIFATLGIPVSPEKLAAEGTPSTTVRVLGVILDTVLMQARLDDDRLAALRAEFQKWADRKTCTKKDLQSITGTLMFAANVVPAGRIFVRHLINLLCKAHRSHHHIKINAEAREDIQWWRTFVVDGNWNGKSILLDAKWSQPPQVTAISGPCPDAIYTDASGAGFGAVFGSRWLHGLWSEQELSESKRESIVSSTYVEFRAIAIALATWGHLCAGRRLTIRSDSNVAVQTFSDMSARHPALVQLIRTILFSAATHNFSVRLRHIEGKANVYADLLSRGQVQVFQNCQSAFARSPDAPLPPPLRTW